MKILDKTTDLIEHYCPTAVNAYKFLSERETLDHKDDVSYKKQGNLKGNQETEGDKDMVIYLGKIFRNRIWRTAFYFGIGYKADNKIYSEEFLKATLRYALSNTPTDGKVRIVIGRILSELFNGEKDILSQTYSLDEEKELINLLAKTNSKYKNQKIQIVSMDEMPENETLFKRLRNCIDPKTNVLDIKKAYMSEKEPSISKDSSSFEIAQFLYYAMQKNDDLKKAFLKMRPAKIRNQDNYDDASNYYGLTEVAIRLREILSGTYTHIGVDRQGVYDDIIAKIVCGRRSKCKFSKIKELYPLYDLLADKPFDTVHVKKDNDYEKQIQWNCAFTRACIYATLVAWLFAGGKLAYEEFKELRTKEAFSLNQSEKMKEQRDNNSISEVLDQIGNLADNK